MRTLDSRALGSPDSASLVPICFLVFFMCDGQPVVGTVSTPFDFSTGPGLKSSFDRQYCSYAQCCHNLRRRRSVFLRWWPQSQVSTDSIADLSSDVRICVDVVRFFYVGGHNIYLPGGSGLTFWRHWSPKIAFGFCWSLPMRAEARWPRRLFAVRSHQGGILCGHQRKKPSDVDADSDNTAQNCNTVGRNLTLWPPTML